MRDSSVFTDHLSVPLLTERLESFRKLRVLVIGDVMLDEYLIGDAYRISPEAPVPVVHIEKEKRLVGGAGNVARNITALGAQATLVGVRGSDAAGRKLEQSLHNDRVVFSLLSLNKRPTTVKTRIMARQQQVLRFDREDTAPLPESDTNAILGLVAEHLPECAAIVISDYGKGLVSKTLMQGLHAVMDASGRRVPIAVDPKPRNRDFYKGVTILTPNTKETGESVHMPVSTREDIIKAGQALMGELECPHLLTTLGSQGMAVFETPGEIWHIPTTARQVFDVTGAGDTVIATLVLGMAAGLPLVQAALLANYAAGIVVGMVGAGTVTAGQIIEAAATLPAPQIAKWM